MPRIINSMLASILFTSITFAQVGIGTANVASGALLQLESTTAAFVLPRMSDTQMTAINAPLQGAMVFNNSENLPYFRGASGWSGFDLNSNPAIILTRANGTFATSPTTPYFMILNSTHATSISSAYFSVPSQGTVQVTRNGTYLLSVSLSTSNMPAGSRNYYLAVYRNGSFIGYMSRGRLDNPSTDYWGVTGTLMYPASAGDEFSFKYFIDYNSSLTNVFQTICITKLN